MMLALAISILFAMRLILPSISSTEHYIIPIVIWSLVLAGIFFNAVLGICGNNCTPAPSQNNHLEFGYR